MAEERHVADQSLVEEIIVWGRAEAQKGAANSASSGLVGYADFSTRPLQRVGELVEVVPGLVATQHSGEGKANQYFLRGMNLDHGTDFSAFFEGMPINHRAHAHGQGYLDLNFLIPEIVSTVRYSKGPYAADRGDFSTAGTTSIAIYDRVDPFVDLTAGSYGYRRLVSAGSRDTVTGHLLGAVEVQRSDGPWRLAADIEKLNLIAQYSGNWRDHAFSVIASHYDNDWRATDQIPRRLVSAGTLSRFGFIDPTLGGYTDRSSVIANLESPSTQIGIFASRYALNLFGNPTYFLDDAVNGDQIEQVDRRWIYGGHAAMLDDLTDTLSWRVGADLRIDDIAAANLYRTNARRRHAAVREDRIDWRSLGLYAELDAQLTSKLRATAGVRGDIYDYEVSALRRANSGGDTEHHLAPKLNLAYDVNDTTEVYLNWGRGFHSNDVRGRTVTFDPSTGAPVERVGLFVDQEGAEAGIRVEHHAGLVLTAAYFWLESDSELLFVGDSGATEPSDASSRTGFELNAFWAIAERWTADLIGALVDSEFTGVPRGFHHIPNAHRQVVGAGVTYVEPGGITASLRVRHFGDAPLVEDDSVQHDPTTLINASAAYDFGPIELGVEIINLLDADDDDIAYFFDSRLADETEPVSDVHFHPVDPLSLRVNIRWEL